MLYFCIILISIELKITSLVIPQPLLKLWRAGADLTAKPDEAESKVGESSFKSRVKP